MTTEDKDIVIRNLVRGILSSELSKIATLRDGAVLTLDSRLKEDLDLDSLEILELVVSMEDLYNVSINNSLMDFKLVKTAKDLADFAAARIGLPVKSL